jgi:hypothetical protein
VGWLFRAGTAGTVANSIVAEMKNKGIEVQDRAAGVNDAYSKLGTEELQILNNLFWNCGDNTTLDGGTTGIIRVTSGAEDVDATGLSNHLMTNENLIDNPELTQVSRDQDQKLDPRPSLTGAAYASNLATLPAGDDFFVEVDYKGAFSGDFSDLWLKGWTALDRNAHLTTDGSTSVSERFDRILKDHFKIFPNPLSSGSQFNIEFDYKSNVRIDIYSIDGRLIRTIPVLGAGNTNVQIEALNKGSYVVKFTTDQGHFAAKQLIVY